MIPNVNYSVDGTYHQITGQIIRMIVMTTVIPMSMTVLRFVMEMQSCRISGLIMMVMDLVLEMKSKVIVQQMSLKDGFLITQTPMIIVIRIIMTAWIFVMVAMKL